jgi:CheY-like chemotaxis protein
MSTGQPLRGVTVMVVDDENDSRETTSLLLEVLGARVIRARDGAEALGLVVPRVPDFGKHGTA